jgi:hypothetical protein
MTIDIELRRLSYGKTKRRCGPTNPNRGQTGLRFVPGVNLIALLTELQAHLPEKEFQQWRSTNKQKPAAIEEASEGALFGWVSRRGSRSVVSEKNGFTLKQHAQSIQVPVTDYCPMTVLLLGPVEPQSPVLDAGFDVGFTNSHDHVELPSAARSAGYSLSSAHAGLGQTSQQRNSDPFGEHQSPRHFAFQRVADSSGFYCRGSGGSRKPARPRRTTQCPRQGSSRAIGTFREFRRGNRTGGSLRAWSQNSRPSHRPGMASSNLQAEE